MRVNMAVNAGLELHIFVTRRSAGQIRLVALLAGNLDVQTGQRVASLGVIEVVCSFPIREVMAGLAFSSELTLVWIFVACNAIL